MSETDLEAAVRRAENWREQFARETVVLGDVRLNCTFSAGVALYPQHGATGDSVVKAADEALYQAKSDGRNCVRVHEGGHV